MTGSLRPEGPKPVRQPNGTAESAGRRPSKPLDVVKGVAATLAFGAIGWLAIGDAVAGAPGAVVWSVVLGVCFVAALALTIRAVVR